MNDGTAIAMTTAFIFFIIRFTMSGRSASAVIRGGLERNTRIQA